MEAVLEKAKLIRLLILDVDGVMTDGTLYYGADAIELKGFHVHDGLGIKLVQQSGITVAVISAKKSAAVERRLKDLQIKFVYLGHEKKLPIYEDVKATCQLEDHQIAYMGDDLPDLPLLKRAGLAITVPQAPEMIKAQVDWVTKNQAGGGAVREVCDILMKTQDRYQAVMRPYDV